METWVIRPSQCQKRNKNSSWGQKGTQSLKMLLSDNVYSFTHFIDYKRPLKLTHLRFGEILCRQKETWKVRKSRHKAVCVTEEEEPTTLDDSSGGHDGNMAGRRWWGQLQQFSESVPHCGKMRSLWQQHHLESIPGKLNFDTCFQPAEEDLFLRQVLPEPGAGKRKKPKVALSPLALYHAWMNTFFPLDYSNFLFFQCRMT